jgi:acyl-CoA hydrolase
MEAGLEAARHLLRRGGRIAFPPAMGEPDLAAELPRMLAGVQAEVLHGYRTRRAALDFDSGIRRRVVFGAGRASGLDYAPMAYGSLPKLIRPGGPLAIDVAIVRVAPADAAGIHNVGPSATMTADIALAARALIAEIDPDLPRTCGKTGVPADLVTIFIESRQPLELPATGRPNAAQEAHSRMAAHVAELVPDGAHVEFGMGSVAQAIATGLRDHRKLRIHAGLLGPALVSLLESDAVDCDWVVPVGEAIGPGSLMSYIHRNQRLDFQSTSRLHDFRDLGQHEEFYTINSVLAVDLLGRAGCEGELLRPAGGIGGLAEFLEGGRRSTKGRNLLVISSRRRNGRSRIVPLLPSEEVSIPTYLVDHVITEWGAADLRGATRREIAERLISIAHPEDRSKLADEFTART